MSEELITPTQAEEIRKAERRRDSAVIAPSPWMYWNVHLDGLEYTHDLIVEREGVFKECIAAIRMAKILGYQVATNTTVYKETDVQEIEEMFEFSQLRSKSMATRFRPGYDYDAAKKDMVKRLESAARRIFPDARDDHARSSRRFEEWGETFHASSARRFIRNSSPANAN